MLRAAEHFTVSEQFIEKDYYVTEILRIVADRLGDKAMFKGGTSLSKGWALINRFSEDIDLFVNREKFEPLPGTHKTDKILKELSEAVAEHPALTWLRDEGAPIGGLGREDYFQYGSRFGELPGIRPVVRLEPGIQSGTFPTEVVPITSMIGRYLLEQGRADMADDLMGFDMTLLHFRRIAHQNCPGSNDHRFRRHSRTLAHPAVVSLPVSFESVRVRLSCAGRAIVRPRSATEG